MGSTGRERRELVSFAAVMLLIAGVSVTVVTSCGGGGSSDGSLCQQCGDTDGPCQRTDEVSGTDRPAFCGDRDPCTVELRCLRKLDSSQRRCFPANPLTNELDILYRCDGSRPNPSIVPTTTATPLPTPTDTSAASPTTTSSGPSSPTPQSTAGATDVDVTATIDTTADTFSSSFVVVVTYPAAKGDFRSAGTTNCEPDDGLTTVDDGNGKLTLAFPGDPTDAFPVGVTCTFHQKAGETLTNADLATQASSPLLTVEIDPL